MHGNVEKGLDCCLPFQVMASFFSIDLFQGVFQENQHLLILDGHGFQVIISTKTNNRSWVKHGHLTLFIFHMRYSH